MSGFDVRKVTIVDSTARSSGASSRNRECGGEVVGDETADELVEEIEGSTGVVEFCAEGVNADGEGNAR
jgi:hypothetical protein